MGTWKGKNSTPRTHLCCTYSLNHKACTVFQERYCVQFPLSTDPSTYLSPHFADFVVSVVGCSAASVRTGGQHVAFKPFIEPKIWVFLVRERRVVLLSRLLSQWCSRESGSNPYLDDRVIYIHPKSSTKTRPARDPGP